MTYDEVASGSVVVQGCLLVAVWHPSVTVFGIGDIVYSGPKANRGVLEKVVIKMARTVASRRTGGLRRTLYTDTLNGLWNEEELVPFDKAVALTGAYYLRLEQTASKLKAC